MPLHVVERVRQTEAAAAAAKDDMNARRTRRQCGM